MSEPKPAPAFNPLIDQRLRRFAVGLSGGGAVFPGAYVCQMLSSTRHVKRYVGERLRPSQVERLARSVLPFR